jgi:hypothetical protein
MQIKFLTLYHNFTDPDHARHYAQDNLLYMWQRSLQLKNIKFIPRALVEFKDYSFFEYPDQVKAKQEIHNIYGHKLTKQDGGGVIYRWCGEEYSDLDILYNALAEQKRFMELIITVEDSYGY